MNFWKIINLELRRHFLCIYNFLAPWIVKTGITKLRLGKTTLGFMIRSSFVKTLHFSLPDPIEAKGIVMYHRTTSGRGDWGWCYAFDYESETSNTFMQIVKPGMTVVDIGAHLGYYSLLSAKLVGTQGKVFSFEPDPEYHSLLAKNIRANKFDLIIESFRVAVGDKKGKTILFLGKSTGTSLFKTPDAMGQTTITEVLSLDEFFLGRAWPSVDIVKIDIEGAERLALAGMRHFVKKNPGLKLLIELNPSFLKIADTSPEDILTLLNELGFNTIRVLSGQMDTYKLPQDTQSLLNFARGLNYVNLLCEKHN